MCPILQAHLDYTITEGGAMEVPRTEGIGLDTQIPYSRKTSWKKIRDFIQGLLRGEQKFCPGQLRGEQQFCKFGRIAKFGNIKHNIQLLVAIGYHLYPQWFSPVPPFPKLLLILGCKEDFLPSSLCAELEHVRLFVLHRLHTVT